MSRVTIIYDTFWRDYILYYAFRCLKYFVYIVPAAAADDCRNTADG